MEIGLGGIISNNIETNGQKEYTRIIEGHPIRMANCEVFVLNKNTIQTHQRKDLGSKTDIIAMSNNINFQDIGTLGVERATNRYIEQDEDTGTFKQYIFKCKKNLIDGYNSFFQQLDIDISISNIRRTTINNKTNNLSIKQGDISSTQDFLTSLWMLSIFYGKRTDPFTNCTINLPLNPYNFKKADNIIEKCNQLINEGLWIKYQKSDNILHISISDIQILDIFKKWGHPEFDNITTISYNGHLSKLFEGFQNFKLDFKDKTLKIVSTT